MKNKFEKYFSKELSRKEKEELLLQIKNEQKFREDLISHCLLIKSMISIEKERNKHLFISIQVQGCK